MPEEIVPKEQMEVFNQGRTERRPSLPPRRMAEAPMEEAISEVPMEQEEVMDSGLSRSDPKTLLADFGTFLIGLPNEKITFMKSFVLDNPPITEAVSDTLQMPPEDLNDIFNALLGDGEASKTSSTNGARQRISLTTIILILLALPNPPNLATVGPNTGVRICQMKLA